MTKMIALSDRLGAWAEEQAADNNFASAGDYVESLLMRERRDRESLAEFDRLVQEGEDSGVCERSMEEILADAREQARARANARL